MVRLDHVVQGWLRAQAAPNASVKAAQKFILGGGVCVAGVAIREPKTQVVPGVEKITLNATGEELPLEKHAFLLMHKPKGCVCQRHPREPTVYSLLPLEHQNGNLVCVGRLDRDTTGALLFGTDGGLQSMLLHPTSRVWKVYLADCVGELASDAEQRFRAGLALEDGKQCAPAFLEVLPPEDSTVNIHVRVTLHEGFFHQVKRMLSSCGVSVVALHRERFGLLNVAGLQPGELRALTAVEMAGLCDMLPETRMPRKEVSWRPKNIDSTTYSLQQTQSGGDSGGSSASS